MRYLDNINKKYTLDIEILRTSISHSSADLIFIID